jgi:hypothetical protein
LKGHGFLPCRYPATEIAALAADFRKAKAAESGGFFEAFETSY